MAYEFPYDAILRINGLISRGVKAAEIDGRGHLLLTLTDGTVADLGSAVGPQGERGFTFTPSVDDSGNVSWTNNGGLENPATKNIRGPRGFKFTPEVSDGGDLSWSNDGGLQNPATKNIRGPRGFKFTPEVSDGGDLSWSNDGGLQNPATKNIRGPRGFTFTPSVDDSGNVSWTNNGGLQNPATKNIRGPQGRTGAPGYSPTVQISKTGKVTTVTITDENGAHTSTINDGQDGTGSGNMHTSTYDPQGKAQDVFAYADTKLAPTGDGSNVTAGFKAASSRTNIATGEKLSVIFGKIAKWLADLKTVAFTGAYSDLTGKPTIPASAEDVGAVGTTGDGSNVTTAFTKATSRTNIASGEKLSVLFGKIAKWLADLGSLAFKSKVAKADLAEDVQMSLGKADKAITVTASTADNGKFLRVVNGAWAAATVDNANGVSF